MFKGLKKKAHNYLRNKKMIISLMVVMVIMAAFYSVGFCTTTVSALTIDFDVAAMFSWTQIIISALMPIVYVLMGIGLGFLIINNLKNAFVGSMH